MTEKIVPDTSVIIDGKLTELVELNRLQDAEVLVPELVVDELEGQANEGREIGYAGLEELKTLQEYADSQEVEVSYIGRRATEEEVDMAAEGRIDALIRDIAEEEEATLYTADYVQYRVAEAKGTPVKFFEKDHEVEFSIRDYFEEGVMSVHLKQGDVPKAKRGEPGELEYQDIGDEELSKADLQQLMKEVIETAKSSDEGLMEMDMEGATVVQIGDLRIAMTQPPFSEAREITAVRPIAKVELDDYDISDKLRKRLTEKAEGILIAGSPGHGKSTFAQALAEVYEEEGKVVKTMEHPRDLQVGPEITQYSKLEGEMENTGDLLLLVRPDYTVYDEVRKTEDFEVFSDMRLAGVGMMGVVHASDALDSIQRLIGRVELGVIPQVVDTVVFIENAEVSKVYKLELTVKVPTGMTEADLARPVIQVKDFETDNPEYEIYTYGEETVVIPVTGEDTGSKMEQFAARQLEHDLSQYVDDPMVEFESEDHITLYVEEGDIAGLIGQGGENIDRIEEEVGINITVEPREGGVGDGEEEINYTLDDSGDQVVVMVDERYSGRDVQFYRGNESMFSATVGRGGKIALKEQSDFAQQLLDAEGSGELVAKV
ncbi:MAG: PINc/VapC family ATPase [Candidatus Nanohaloarchaeota archaeon QJJ-7]|nr:PINc/VapC family ATPase [Candidatus Nanohaloarchaeota archaeon QJJ-7]